LFERVLTPVHLAYADIVDGPAASHAARRDLALAYHRATLRQGSSLVLLMLHEAIDDPAGLLRGHSPVRGAIPVPLTLNLPSSLPACTAHNGPPRDRARQFSWTSMVALSTPPPRKPGASM